MPARRIDVYSTLLDEITTWRTPPGSPLREEELAGRLGVSRTPVREALARLRADGLVEQRSGQIAAVSTVGADTAIAVYQARDALESYGVQLAALSPQRSLFGPLEVSYNQFADAARDPSRSAQRLYEITDQFDDALRAAVPNPYLLVPLQSTRAALARLRRLAMFDPARLTAAAQQRGAECRAIAAGDANSAGRLSHQRIADSLSHVLDALFEGRTAPVVSPPLR